MGSRNYIIPSDDMTLTDKTNYRISAIAAGLAKAHGTTIGNISDSEIPGFSKLGTPEQRFAAILNYLKASNFPAAFAVREFQPILDAGTVLDQWNTAALAVVGTAYSALQAIAAPANATNKVLVFYKTGVETAPMPVSRLQFRQGGAAGNIMGIFDLEQIINHQNVEGYFSEPVVVGPAITYAIQVLARIATGVLARVQVGSFVIEPAGQVVA